MSQGAVWAGPTAGALVERRALGLARADRLDRVSRAVMEKELDILIVEDVPADAEAIVRQLQQDGLRFQARRVETRQEFLAALQAGPPDVIISDFTLPAFDGLQALRLAQAHAPEAPFLVVTGPRSEAVAVECMKEGADDYILKDTLMRLPSAVLNALRKKAAERERAWAEAALRRSEELFRVITESTRDLVALLDPEGRFLYANPSYRHRLGLEPAELLGSEAFGLVHPADAPGFRQAWAQARARREPLVAEVRLQGRTGVWATFETVGHWVYDDAGQAHRAVLVSRDITRRKLAEEKLRNLPRLIVEAQEAERRRVARELHDSVNQLLSSARFRVQSIEERLQARDESLWRETLKVQALLARAIEEVRRISRNLRPSELDDLGLVPALRSLCAEFAERTGLRLTVALDEPPEPCSKETELTLYRVVQEALTNIAKHAQASNVEVRLSWQNGAVQAVIRDDGAGFEPQAVGAGKPDPVGMGLLDMRERAAHVGGSCVVHSAPGQGTEVVVTLPLQPEPSAVASSCEKRRRKKKD